MEPGTTTAAMPPRDFVKEAGLSVSVATIGGSAFYFLKGLRSSPKGGRLAGGAQAIRTNAPRIGRWGAWLGVQAAVDSALQRVNKKDDRFNSMISWGAASAVVSMLRGPRAALLSGITGAVFGGLAEIATCGLEHLTANLLEN